MAKSNELNVDVNVRLSVSDDVAERCMQLLAMYLDDNPEKTPLMERDENGKHHGKIDDLTAPEPRQGAGDRPRESAVCDTVRVVTAEGR